MKEHLLVKADRYFANPDTRLARTLNRISPKKGNEYRTSTEKIIFERIVALPMAIAATPVIEALAVAIKVEEGLKAPVFYKAKRVGKAGEDFTMWKMRSLPVGADKDQQANIANAKTAGIPKDPRSTRVGTWMRGKRLDELPQLWQVVGGKMALFGIRAADELDLHMVKKDKKISGEKYIAEYKLSPPALFNPMAAFYKTGTPTERYYLNSAYTDRLASLSFDLYMGFRSFAKSQVDKAKKAALRGI